MTVSWKNPLLLFLCAAIWGVAFVAQSVGMEYVEPFTFNCIRSLIGAVVLLPFIFWLDRRKGAGGVISWRQRETFRGGICCGAALFVASGLQQFGMLYTTAGKAGFITALYIVLVPLIGVFFMKKKIGVQIWLGVALAVAGLYRLCISDQFSVNPGDLLIMLCAVAFAVQILAIDYFSPKADGIKMACIQFFVCGILSGAGMLATETPQPEQIMNAWLPLLYAGALSCGVAYTLQIIGQKGMDPTLASLILSLESVVSVLAAWLLQGQKLSARELSGCVLMFAAIILAQLPEKKSGSGKLRKKGNGK